MHTKHRILFQTALKRQKKNPTLSRKILDGVGIVMLITAEYVSGLMDGLIP
jgi:hypothetical protein